ncbi:MAG: HAMP domain-containing histidine kinase [Elusimicrobia bacterium]|nr:HAMP domain-containing histidine kinase [Elusimicrobiota bacterium]
MTTTNQTELLERLTHDVRSKCSSLKSAAELLQQASPEEIRELLPLMTEAARNMSQKIADYEKNWNNNPSICKEPSQG